MQSSWNQFFFLIPPQTGKYYLLVAQFYKYSSPSYRPKYNDGFKAVTDSWPKKSSQASQTDFGWFCRPFYARRAIGEVTTASRRHRSTGHPLPARSLHLGSITPHTLCLTNLAVSKHITASFFPTLVFSNSSVTRPLISSSCWFF